MTTFRDFAGVAPVPPVVEAVRILDRGRDTDVLEIFCPWCGELHYHGGCGAPGFGNGHRSAHCGAESSPGCWYTVGYVLREVGVQEGRRRTRRLRGDVIRILPPRAAGVACDRPAISVAQRTRIMERDDFRCRRCGAGPRDERLVIDHVVPIALGGSSDDDNLQTLCEPCNQGKGARPPHPHDLEPR